jgi:hypothetical protein
MSLKIEMQKISSGTFTSKFGQFKIHYVIIDRLGMIDIFIAQSHSVDVGTNDVIQVIFVVVRVFDRFRRDVTDLDAVASTGRKFQVVPQIFSKFVVF